MNGKRRSTEIQYAVGYVRVSSDEQAREDRFSLRAQRKEIKAYCERRGWILHEYIYEDAGHSAKGGDINTRPDFKRMLDEVTSGQARCDVVVTHTLDRYARNMIVALTTLADLNDHGITYSSVTESDFDYSNADKRIHLQMLAMFAEYFSVKLSQHTRKGKKERAESGLPNGDLPYGFVNPDTGTEHSGAGVFNSSVAMQVQEEATHVQRAYEAYASGTCSDLNVAKILNAAGSRTRNKRSDGSRPWSKDTVTALLTNPFYAGWIEYRGEGVKRSEPAQLSHGKHEPIISQELYDKVQNIRKSRTRRAAIPAQQKQPYILAGLAKCAHCYDALRVQSQPRGAYYRCTALDRQTECSCVKKAARAGLVDAQLGEIIGQLRLAPDWKERALEIASVDIDRDAIEAERERITRRLAKIRRLTIDEIMTQEEYEREKVELTDKLARLTVPADVDLDTAAGVLENLQQLWVHPATTTEDKVAIARKLIESVLVDTDCDTIKEIHLQGELEPLFTVLPSQVYLAHSPRLNPTSTAGTHDGVMYTTCGTDGIRTRDLLRDRQAC